MVDHSFIGSSGEVEKYHDPYGNVTDKEVERAEAIEHDIRTHSAQIEIHHLKLANAISEFKRDKLYLARGFATFTTWAKSPELGMEYRTIQNLLRIEEELLPLMQKNDVMDQMPPISTMYSLLPILGDDDAEAKVLEALERVQGLTVADAKREIREVRGLTNVTNTEPTLFTGQVSLGDDVNEVDIWASNDNDYYRVTASTPLVVKKADWASFESQFGKLLNINT